MTAGNTGVLLTDLSLEPNAELDTQAMLKKYLLMNESSFQP